MRDNVRIYLDNCCFNRPYDDQSQLRIDLETQAKLNLQSLVRGDKLELAWSYILDYENAANPFEERKREIGLWRNHASVDIEESPEVLNLAEVLQSRGFTIMDSLHLACAIAGNCQIFYTTDDRILRKGSLVTGIQIKNPLSSVIEDLL